MKKQLRGIGIALATPFDEKNRVDFKGLERLTEHVLKEDIDYLVLLGTTAESATLKNEEKNDIIRCIHSMNKKKVPIVLSIGGNNTEKVIQKIEQTQIFDFEAILSIVPYYNRPSQEGIYQHFKQIVEKTKAKIILYNVPSRTGSNILPKTVLRLSKEFENIVAIKEVSGSLIQSYEIIKEKPTHFSVISGDDILALPTILGGGDGLISVLGQGFPNVFSKMVHNALEGNVKESFKHYYQMLDLMNLIYKEGNPSGIKSLLHILNVCESYVRLPIVRASEILSRKIEEALKRYIKICNKKTSV
ncbi:4-hydroxy-tetrahydrodipicolinate synthase [Candidatus Walczuchella endosymbiont of Icerya purchasi]|uniref:4-hydroxy-tetrahydrodipicolinate synthase n=1 Tax=Candidatus Walczuchella endosymbiont of Icerya purchasi TaxID=3066219 RepID=UPI00313E8045